MKIKGKYIKRGTIITVVSIIVLTLATMNVSYSSFFSVQTQSSVPVITAGNLNVTASISGMDENKELMPSQGYEKITDAGSALSDEDYVMSTLSINNSSNIDIKIGASLSNTASNENASPESVVIAIQKDKKWIQFGTSGSFYVKLSQLVKSGESYPIINDKITNGTKTASYDIYMWLANEALEDDVEKALNYSVSVKAIPAEGQDNSNSVPDVSANKS